MTRDHCWLAATAAASSSGLLSSLSDCSSRSGSCAVAAAPALRCHVRGVPAAAGAALASNAGSGNSGAFCGDRPAVLAVAASVYAGGRMLADDAQFPCSSAKACANCSACRASNEHQGCTARVGPSPRFAAFRSAIGVHRDMRMTISYHQRPDIKTGQPAESRPHQSHQRHRVSTPGSVEASPRLS
jgi:phage-related tail fiber protein